MNENGYSGFGSHITTPQKFKNILHFDPEVPRPVPMRNEWVTTIKSTQTMKYCLVIKRNKL